MLFAETIDGGVAVFFRPFLLSANLALIDYFEQELHLFLGKDLCHFLSY